MKNIFPILLLILVQGCATWSRHWDLGVCQKLPVETYGCTVKVPKCLAAVALVIESPRGTNNQTASTVGIRILIRNEEKHPIKILGRGIFDLKPGESFTVTTEPYFKELQGYICSFDTQSGAVQVTINVLDKPLGEAAINIAAEASDGP